MIETVFSKSAYGSLKLAQNCGADKHSSASIGLVLSGRTNISPEELETLKADAELQAHRKWETSIPLGGNPADVYASMSQDAWVIFPMMRLATTARAY